MVTGFIFAAGFGERLRPLTNEIPKPLLPVLNLPAICYALFLLKEAGIDQVIINLHYRHMDIINFFRKHNNFGLKIEFSIEDTILGTGGGLKKCEDIIGESEVLLVNSDVILDINLKTLIDLHKENKSPATLVLKKTDDAKNIGPVSIDGIRIIDFKNFLGTNKTSEHIYTGVAIISPVIFNYLNIEFSSIVYTGYVELIKRHFVSFYEYTGYWQDIGTVNSYWKANLDLMKNSGDIGKRMMPVVGLVPEKIFSYTDKGKSIEVNDSIIGHNVVIGEGAVIERCVILPGSVIEKDARVTDSVVFGNRVFRVI